MASSNLTEKVIIDKNGKTTTVRVRLDAVDSSTSTDRLEVYTRQNPPRIKTPLGSYAFSVGVGRAHRGAMLANKRNPRDVFYTDYVVVDVPSVTEDEAPLGMKVGDKEYRSFDGALYAKVEASDGGAGVEAEEYFADTPALAEDYAHSNSLGAPDYGDVFNAYSDKYAVIDGYVWEKTPEPVYAVNVNRTWADTYVSLDIITDPWKMDRERNDHIFSANERDAAIEYAVKSLPEDSSDLARIKDVGTIDVIDPSSVGSTRAFAARVNYEEFPSYDEPDAKKAEVLQSYRDAISSIDGAVTDEGGYKKVDWTHVPDDLKFNYDRAIDWMKSSDILV